MVDTQIGIPRRPDGPRSPVIGASDLVARFPSPAFAGRPLVVELAGLAGAGKSTIALKLAQLDPEIRARPRVSGAGYLAVVPPLVPTFVGLHWPFRGLLRKEMKRMVRVSALHRLVRKITGRGTLLFDEGPVYMLARILVFGGDNLRTPAFERWWRTAIAQWAATLDVVVWLDAADDVLAARIHTRRQPHPFQGADAAAVSAFLGSYRDAFSRVLAELRSAGAPSLRTVATEEGSADRTAREILAHLRATPRVGPVPPGAEAAR